MAVLKDILNRIPSQLHHTLRDLANRTDFKYPRGCERSDQIQQLSTFSSETVGTFSLVFYIDGERFQTVNIHHQAGATLVQSHVDNALPDQVKVSGGSLKNKPLQFAFTGKKVRSRNHKLLGVDSRHLRGKVGEVSVVTNGQKQRPAMAALVGLGAVMNCPVFGKCPNRWEVRTSSDMANYPTRHTLSFLSNLYFQEESNLEAYNTLRAALGVGQ